MIQERSMLTVADNSGAKIIQCFRVLGATRRRYARIGDVIVASVKKAEPRKAIKKKDIVRAVIIRQKQPLRRADGSYIRFDENAAILIDAKQEPKATRIFGPVPREIKEKGFEKILTMAKEIV
ncbi:50S ribosomal protein L14 [Candidatus Wolfebacteria bacterium CG18_big_fil_WC_8_21_14_2_50_39_7]|uniref:Large ribosomal subunit protein uL14 n=5 Tax=Candidatus Wolfeibacteriota TaxID=1752735 RepID=A0A2M7Q6F9_9BACT|nr:50S ribosomal protein L14 [Parcubacteria group bacterium]NCO89410.1 50S ribosomal protein L14 [Candidatus Wolfebacteria bacterium]OIO65482.1 MAG: 50S ribosomal protein L14 [Candidatus Wolfebacteria bacterium CG1_02_39_135]PIP91961.1 MAG: 50S ribosomal protein L14 [Candidatus Wolfebacteria bacterium CG18_big_fil_WC_8_21_14_2_50_39_7]PIU98740.1 MAG: 50S ribosomal protein L14 [Candidatus Wolfebacteria bacterium CG03_land_8_20_14_0_80_39_317]PIY59016.1 MAG: 50S ribosomal protein L14 [Candidatus